jgi:hypothetical protein
MMKYGAPEKIREVKTGRQFIKEGEQDCENIQASVRSEGSDVIKCVKEQGQRKVS